ncbi:MAG: DNA polymerase III subunit delta [Alistipes sp.]|nr:DNA polymerase III subunit delta [Candidatus Alistipes equi]
MAAAKVSFQESLRQYRLIMDEISRGVFHPLYLLTGEESYFIDAICNRLANSILSEEERTFNQIVLYGKDTDGATIASYCRQVPMMGRYEVIIVKEAQQLSSLDRLLSYVKSPVASTILVVCYKEKTMDKRLQIYKAFLEKGVILESVVARDYELSSTLRPFLVSLGINLSSEAEKILLEHIGTSLSRIVQEMEKIKLAVADEAHVVTPDDIEKYVGISKEYNNFELQKAVARRDVKLALRIMDNILSNTKGFAGLSIKSIYDMFRSIFSYNILMWQQSTSRRPAMRPDEMAKEMKIQPFLLREYAEYAKLWKNQTVFRVLGILREYESKTKGINSGQKDAQALMQEMLLKIFYA